jgi:hypothetical protein
MDNEYINMPFDLANEKALKNWEWMNLWRIGLQLFRGEFVYRTNRIESL